MEGQAGGTVSATEALLGHLAEEWAEKAKRRINFDGEASLKVTIRNGRLAEVHLDEHLKMSGDRALSAPSL